MPVFETLPNLNMSITYIPAAVRREVRRLAGDKCEYCRYPEIYAYYAYHFDHIIPEKQGGETALANLALSCRTCNISKGVSIVSYDVATDQVIRLFHPRKQRWDDHFVLLSNGLLEPTTDSATATIEVLRMNEPERVKERLTLIRLNLI